MIQVAQHRVRVCVDEWRVQRPARDNSRNRSATSEHRKCAAAPTRNPADLGTQIVVARRAGTLGASASGEASARSQVSGRQGRLRQRVTSPVLHRGDDWIIPVPNIAGVAVTA